MYIERERARDIHSYVIVYISYMCVCIYIYIYIERERERAQSRVSKGFARDRAASDNVDWLHGCCCWAALLV